MKRLNVFAVAVLGLAITGSAAAGSVIVKGYGGNAGAPVANVLGAHTSKAPAAAHTSGTLPFTGINLLVIALVAVALIGLGWALMRSSRGNNTPA